MPSLSAPPPPFLCREYAAGEISPVSNFYLLSLIFSLENYLKSILFEYLLTAIAWPDGFLWPKRQLII